MMEPKGKGKAEVALRTLLVEAVMLRDWAQVWQALNWYGDYLLLTGMDAPVGEVRVFTLWRFPR